MHTRTQVLGAVSPLPAAALALVVSGATALGVASWVWREPTSPEAVVVAGTLAGWVLLAWGAIVGVVALAARLRGRSSASRTARLDGVVLALTAAVMVAALVAVPLVGAGGATA